MPSPVHAVSGDGGRWAERTESAMERLQLRAVSRGQGNNQAVKDGSIRPHQADLVFEEVPVLVQAFRRMVRALEFDVCEMAFTTYLCAREHGKPFTALPIFLVRGFHHGAVVRRVGAADVTPGALRGARVGVNRGYTVTTGVWARGILQDEHGVDPGDVTWVISGDEHVEEYRAPSNVVPMATGATLADLLQSGDLAAVVGADLDPSTVEPVIEDPDKAAERALVERGFYPINHLVVVRDELVAKHPDLAADLFWTFAKAKAAYVERLGNDAIAEPTATDRMYRRVMEVTGADPLPYGVAPNRAMIDTLVSYALRQQILRRPVTAEDLFVDSTTSLEA